MRELLLLLLSTWAGCTVRNDGQVRIIHTRCVF
jgi:hypothetical protein